MGIVIEQAPNPLAMAYVGKNKERILTLSQISMYNFDIKNNLGDLLFRFGKVDFSALATIKEAYKDALGSEIVPIFETSEILFIAEATRHLIAHRSGIVDSKFLKCCGKKHPYCNLQTGDRVPFNGAVVSAQVDACVQTGVALLKWADEWSASREQHTE